MSARKKEPLSRAEALEIFQQSLRELQQSGVKAAIVNHNNGKDVVIFLDCVRLEESKFVLRDKVE